MFQRKILWLILALFIIPLHAFADVVPPEEAACQSKKEAEACSMDNGTQGTCKTSQCTKNACIGDPNSGDPCDTRGPVKYTCLVCAGKGGETNNPGGSPSDTPAFGCSQLSGTAWGNMGLFLAGFFVFLGLCFKRREER